MDTGHSHAIDHVCMDAPAAMDVNQEDSRYA
jgi:hypothetical protein